MKNSFIDQFSENIKFDYTSFDRVIIRGYILRLFSSACVVLFLRAMGFSRSTNGIMRIFTDQLNSHISRQAERLGAPIHWWSSEDGGVNGAKLKFVERVYAEKFRGQGNHLFCIITDKEPVRTFAARKFVSKMGRKYQSLYKCRKPVKQYYIYFHDSVLGGPCYLKISSYLPFPCEFYFNGHNYISQHLDQQGVSYKKYATRSKHLNHLRPARSHSKSFWRLYDNNACIKHWFRGNTIKQFILHL